MAFQTIGAVTTGVQTKTAVGAVTPTAGLDISGITGDWTLFVEVQSLTAGKKAKIQIETTVDSTNWVALDVIDVEGDIESGFDKIYSKRAYEAPSAPFGTSACLVRANVTVIDSAATLALRSWVSY
jgi:hypothetical protein